MFSAILYLRAYLLISVAGFVFQSCLGCAHREVSGVPSENTSSALHVAAQTYSHTSCKSTNARLFHVTLFFQQNENGLKVSCLSAQAEEPWPHHRLSRLGWHTPEDQARAALCSLPEPDLHCAAGRKMHVGWWWGQKIVALGYWGCCLLRGARRNRRPNTPACNSQVGGPSLELRVAPQCKVCEAGVQMNSAYLTKINSVPVQNRSLIHCFLICEQT